MPTALQIKLIHVAAKQAGLAEPQYRTLLRNVGGVESSKLLDQAGFEDCMAVIEDCGFRERERPGNFWRTRVQQRGELANARMVAKIHALAAESRYELAALCGRFSEHRADCPEHLHPKEAWNLIEMLKASNEREAEADAERAEAASIAGEDDLPF